MRRWLAQSVVLGAGLLVMSGLSCSDADEPTPISSNGGSSLGGHAGEVTASGGGASVSDPYALPSLLSETGLYESDMSSIASDVRPYRPRFALWTDGAEKQRWVRLPEGASIDVSDPDVWVYPSGITFFKEFVRDGVRVETRILQKQVNGTWRMGAYHWRADLSDAELVLAGLDNASGTEHDIPSETQCFRCHNQMPDRVIGFSALQLSWGADGMGGAAGVDVLLSDEWSLARLEQAGHLSNTAAELQVPGDLQVQQALGYLHANCGHCHQPQGSAFGRTGLNMWLRADSLNSVSDTTLYQTTVNVELAIPFEGPSDVTLRIAPGDASKSAVYRRMQDVHETWVMPPLGTELQNQAALDNLAAWIDSL